MDVSRWLQEIDLSQYADLFRANDIDAEVLRGMTVEDLKELGVSSFGHRKKLISAIAALKAGEAESPLQEPSPREAAVEGERRHLTVLFCDLVGSTALSAALDPEDMREIIAIYQDAVTKIVDRYDGYVAKFLGDGVLVYFGYPQAHEDDAERAVRAALGLAAVVPALRLPDDRVIACRIGIATGLVVVGAAAAGGVAEQAVTGDTPNLAARLQDVAPANGVVIAASTRRLLRDTFTLQELDRQTVKGLAEPVAAWRVIGEGGAESRFAAARAHGLSRFIGRDSEVAMLLERWQLAEIREGQVVLLSGEAGIGKSRICETLRERLAGRPHGEIRYQCSPYHANSALYPALRHLEHLAGVVESDPPDQRPVKLEAALQASHSDLPPVAIGLLLRAFGWPEGDRLSGHVFSPEEEKARTLTTLVELLMRPAIDQPVLALIEDVHWIDPTTQELIGLLIDRARDRKVLMLITHRPDYRPPWGSHTHLTGLAMNRLSQGQCAALIAEAAQGKPLPVPVVREIIEKTDGVPLFVEELTKTVLESGLLVEDTTAYLLDGPLPSLAIPSSLHDSLTARLDRLSTAKEVAQVGAAIGREFSRSLLAAACAQTAAALEDALARLIDAGLVFRLGSGNDAIYTFKHALIRDAAYDNMLKSRRVVVHRRIAGALADVEGGAVLTAQPELAAHHLTEGGLIAEAIPHWIDAGERAVERSANPEAIAHLSRARDLVRTLPVGTDRDRLEARLLMPLGNAALAVRGTAHPEAEELFRRARQLGANLADSDRYFNATWNLWLVNQSGGKFAETPGLSAELIDLATRSGDREQTLQANHASWATNLIFGEFATSEAQIERGLALYDPVRHRGHAHRFGGHDPGVCGCAFGSIVDWLRGRPAQSIARIEEGLRLAEQRDHPMSQTNMNGWASLCYLLHRDYARALVLADDTVRMEREFQFGVNIWIPLAHVARAGVLAATGERTEGIARLQQIVEMARRTPSTFSGTQAFSVLAAAYRDVGNYTGALAVLEQGIDKASRTGEVWWLAELLRQRGETLLDLHGERAESEQVLRSAVNTAQRQGAVTLIARSIASLSRLLCESGRADEADALQISSLPQL